MSLLAVAACGVSGGGRQPAPSDNREPVASQGSPFRDFAMQEGRFAMLRRSNPEQSDELIAQAQADIDERWHLYTQMVDVERSVPVIDELDVTAEEADE